MTLPSFLGPCIYGFNSSLDGGLAAAATKLGVNSFDTAKIFNASIPASYPGGSYPVPSSVTKPLATIKVSLLTAAPWISTSDQAKLVAVFKSMPLTGKPMVTINNEGEGAAHGFTAQQIIGSHQTAYDLFLANAPANAIYTQALETFSASSGGRGSAFGSFVFCKASGGSADLPIYFLDWYPTSTNTDPAPSIIPAANVIKSLAPAAALGIGETNYIAGTNSIIYSGGQLNWFIKAWEWALPNQVMFFIPFFFKADAKPFPPPSNVVAELAREAHESGL